MSYNGMLVHRCDVKRMTMVDVDGRRHTTWKTIASEKCRVDLQFIRSGRDPQWTPEAGRPSDRTGVTFLSASTVVRVGDRLVITKGPSVTLLVDGAFDQVQGRHGTTHHVEAGCVEVPDSLARADS